MTSLHHGHPGGPLASGRRAGLPPSGTRLGWERDADEWAGPVADDARSRRMSGSFG